MLEPVGELECSRVQRIEADTREEYAQECWCGTSLSKSIDTPNDCTTACTGDESQACGGPERLTVYMNAEMGPSTNPGMNGYVSQGCYTDDVSMRTLSRWVAVDGGLSVDKCTSTCKVGGYTYSGVEYAGGEYSLMYFRYGKSR
jgi:hypothetical protein